MASSRVKTSRRYYRNTTEERIRGGEVRLSDIVTLLQAEVLAPAENMSKEIGDVHASDLISRVLASSSRGALWVTGLLDPQVVNTAELFDLSGIVFVSNRRPSEEIVSEAKAEGIPILVTGYTMFEVCGLLYRHGLVPARRD
jgi:hypothetical protein